MARGDVGDGGGEAEEDDAEEGCLEEAARGSPGGLLWAGAGCWEGGGYGVWVMGMAGEEAGFLIAHA